MEQMRWWMAAAAASGVAAAVALVEVREVAAAGVMAD